MELSKSDCNVLKGLAIIAIMLHNFCHCLPGSPLENEFTWKAEKTQYFFQHFGESPFFNLFSFWGHYGVIIFVFLSGYGLVRKYEQTSTYISSSRFIIIHYMKLLKLMIPGLVIYWFIFWLLYSDLHDTSLSQFTAQLSFIINFIPKYFIEISPGPYWYFGLTMEFYILYKLFLHNKSNSIIIATCCIFCLPLFFANGHYQTMEWLKYNFWGSIIPFSIGILFARGIPHIPISIKCKEMRLLFSTAYALFLILLLLFLILCAEMNYYLWLFISLPIVSLSLCIVRIPIKGFNLVMERIGNVSSLLFVIHPLIRLILLCNKEYMILYPYRTLVIYFICTFMMVPLFIYILSTIEKIQARVSQ